MSSTVPQFTSRRRVGVAVLLGLALTVSSGCGSSDDSAAPAPAGPPPSSAGAAGAGATYTADEVAAATGNYKVKPLYAVPKTLDKQYRLAFLNPSLGYPFFKTWSDGMEAAAEFYGVTIDEADLNFKYDTALTQYMQLSVKKPDALGGGGGSLNAPTVAAAQKAGLPVVSIDGTIEGAKSFGVDDQKVGELAIQALTPAVKAKQAGDWNGKKIVVLGLSAADCTPCDARVKGAFAKAQSDLGVAAADTSLVVPPGKDPTLSAPAAVTDFLTAHPDDAVLVVSYGDQPVVAAVNAAKSAGREKDMLAVANGGDSTARAALREPSNKGILVGAVDYQPYAEGWNFVEAAIASLRGDSFGTFTVDRILTAENVDQFYPGV